MIHTSWGYVIEGESLPSLMTVAEFDAITADKYKNDPRVSSELAAAGMAIRNYCGWHIAPTLTCTIDRGLLYGDGVVKRIGHDLMVQLPTRFLTGITTVKVSDNDYSDLRMNINGTLVVFDVADEDLSRKSQIIVTYAAGLSDALMADIKELMASRVVHSLSSSYGVTSESAGGMSVTYNASWANNTLAAGLNDEAREVLAPYRVGSVL